jgi:hypothetical protein
MNTYSTLLYPLGEAVAAVKNGILR